MINLLNRSATRRATSALDSTWFPCSRVLHSISPPTSSNERNEVYDDKRVADVKHVQWTIDNWVKKYVIQHDLCPFAMKSNYRIAVWPGDTVQEIAEQGTDAKGFVENEVKLLLGSPTPSSKSMNRPNTFVVFPFIDEFILDIHHFNEFYTVIAKTIPGAADQFPFNNPVCKIVPFHLDADWRFKTPWPTLHLLPMSDLNKARQESDGVSDTISNKNNSTLACEFIQRELETILFASLSEPIQITTNFCPKKKAKLQEQGFRIVESKVSIQKDDGSPLDARIKKIPKKRYGKGRPKR